MQLMEIELDDIELMRLQMFSGVINDSLGQIAGELITEQIDDLLADLIVDNAPSRNH